MRWPALPWMRSWKDESRNVYAMMMAVGVCVILAIPSFVGSLKRAFGVDDPGAGAVPAESFGFTGECKKALEDQDAVIQGLTERHRKDLEVQRDRFLDMAAVAAGAMDSAHKAALETRCGEEAVYLEWLAEGCEKRLKARIQTCPCPKVEDDDDVDDEGAQRGW